MIHVLVVAVSNTRSAAEIDNFCSEFCRIISGV
jgi:hypothetical protein